MKIKVVYIYIVLIVAAAAALYFFNAREDKKEIPSSSEIQNQKLPNDDVHSKLKSNAPPSRENLSPEYMAMMNEIKVKYEKNPNDTAITMQYADFLTASHKPDDALPLYQKILDKNPRRLDVLFAMTFIYFNKKEHQKATEITNRILGYDKNNVQAKYNLGAIAANKGDFKEAKTAWENLIREYPNSEISKKAKEQLARLPNNI
ncbi:MAG TPA: tetratricopeptide repeat protein [Ignavibacteriaceae bacterium]|nr:tetratricopeptide repeat protein [Ignavibacteriaceae bacterium]